VHYEDVRIPVDKWPEWKKSGKFEYEQIPALEWKGKMMTLTTAIMMFLAEKLNYLPTQPIIQYEVNSIYLSVMDVFNAFAIYFYMEKDPKVKADKRAAYFEKTVPFYFGLYEKKLSQKTNKNCIVGQAITYADFGFAGFAKTALLVIDKEEYAKAYEKTPLFKKYLDYIVTIC